MESSGPFPKVVSILKSSDNRSFKLKQQVGANNHNSACIETGRYFYENEDIVCISSSIGCNRSCAFCYSTKPDNYSGDLNRRRFLRLLTPDEIVGQVENALSVSPRTDPEKHRLVLSYMGMGEPFDNIRAVKTSILIFSRLYKNIRATVSTIGHKPKLITKLAEEIAAGTYPLLIKLHISLHASTDETRKKLIPYSLPIKDTLEAAQCFPNLTGQIVKLNYILIKNVNCSLDDAQRLGELLGGKNHLILKISELNTHNRRLIPESDEADRFENVLRDYGVMTRRFKGDGLDIQAGCGQYVKSRRTV